MSFIFGGLSKLWGRSREPEQAADGESGCPHAAGRSNVVEVGWWIEAREAKFIYDAPYVYRPSYPAPQHPQAVNKCPGILEYEARHVIVNCPFDLHIRLVRNPQGKFEITVHGMETSVDVHKLQTDILRLQPPASWRTPDRPVLQLATPYRFVADEPVYLNELPPLFNYPKNPLPGLIIGGRFPIDIWPRTLMWAFEWHDISKDLVLRRGEPWFCLRFETMDPSRHIRLVEAEVTPELREYCEGLDQVNNYVGQTFSLFKIARERRPAKLLVKKSR